MPHALAVDDDPNFLSALAELIEGQGFTTNIATTSNSYIASIINANTTTVGNSCTVCNSCNDNTVT